ncbi:MAG: hypothetical protein HOF35_11155 [Bacteroidetes bacterium]|jgi:hypothetical protein|nr:hypothetical protein [Bacteroidota bacterium]MBT3934806.1 hypothetical protein [Bacteroidota bacterium]MBT7825333.1 hypothetical protein [Bacteroidota bacterium]
MDIEDYSSFLIGVVLISGLFLLLREFWCWFWKINEIKDLTIANGKKFDKMNQTLSEILKSNIEINSRNSGVIKSKCRKCAGSISINDKFCQYCGEEVNQK